MRLSRWMAGRKIRWANAGRVAAIIAAVLAGLATLPALLGEDEPPPLPEDVGLGGVAPPPAPVAPTPTAPVVAAKAHPMPAGQRPAKRSRRAASRPSAGERGRSEVPRRARRRESQPDSEAASPLPPPVPTYVPTYAPPPAAPGRQEFRIEG